MSRHRREVRATTSNSRSAPPQGQGAMCHRIVVNKFYGGVLPHGAVSSSTAIPLTPRQRSQLRRFRSRVDRCRSNRLRRKTKRDKRREERKAARQLRRKLRRKKERVKKNKLRKARQKRIRRKLRKGSVRSSITSISCLPLLPLYLYSIHLY